MAGSGNDIYEGDTIIKLGFALDNGTISNIYWAKDSTTDNATSFTATTVDVRVIKFSQ